MLQLEIIPKLPRDPIDTKRLANACIWTENGGCIKRLKIGQKMAELANLLVFTGSLKLPR